MRRSLTRRGAWTLGGPVSSSNDNAREYRRSEHNPGHTGLARRVCESSVELLVHDDGGRGGVTTGRGPTKPAIRVTIPPVKHEPRSDVDRVVGGRAVD